MNWIVGTLLLICVSIHTIYSPTTLLPSMLGGVEQAVEVIISLIPIYALWSALVKILTQSGLNRRISKILSPILDRLFEGESDEVKGCISLNIACNMLGVGSAATPLGIKAISLMDDGSTRTTKHQRIFTVLNTSSIALLPTTVISILTSLGSSTSHSIILPTLIVSIVTSVVGVLMATLSK
ncbi:MAG: spore maturation protein [Clostridia bacterium]|nr:spore maturation protein [Clostridia bacterium]MBR7159948.1 spore maturation protein [Clostridia bacterium]